MFNLWVNAVLKKSLIFISLDKKINSCYLKKIHNFGIDVTKYVAHSYALDENNGNTLWEDSISEEIKDVSPVFRRLDNGYIVSI